jgi:long-chain acyl-CoA synthetase
MTMDSVDSVTTLADLIVVRGRTQQSAETSAILFRSVEKSDSFEERSWNGTIRLTTEYARFLNSQGVYHGHRVVIISKNTPGSVIANLAATALGAVVVPIAAGLPYDTTARLVEDADPRFVLVEDPSWVKRLDNRKGMKVELLLPDAFATLIAHNADANDSFSLEPDKYEEHFRWLAKMAAQVKPDDLANIIYTSGTMGKPRGVMLTHANVLSNAKAATEAFASQHHEVRLNMLPFSHAFARTADLYTWLLRGSTMAVGSTRETIFDDLMAVRPTFITAVPYFYDRLWKRLRAEGIEQEPNAVRNALGGNIRACVSGGAGLPRDVEDYYAGQGIPILQGYGLTEASPIISMSTKTIHRAQTAGQPLPETQLRFADDGELLVKGPQVMSGYWRNEEATANAFDDGWLKTGDIAKLDDDGMLVITGRKKESIVLSTGHNVWPATLEALLTSDAFIAQVAVVGDGQSQLTALIVPEPEPLRNFVKQKGLWVFTKGQALRHNAVRELFAARIAERLCNCARHEQVIRFVLLPRAFSLEEGEVTPKLSLRRDVIARRFAKEIAKVV